jgi:hypothetical protein
MSEPTMADFAFKRMEENEYFLKKNQKEIEIIELINDAIDCMPIGAGKGTKSYIKSAMVFYLHQILLPTSYALYNHLLMGNVPVCFRELRFLYESLAQCYYADLNYPNEDFFGKRLALFKKDLKKEGKSISRLLNEFDKKICAERNIRESWKRLSNEWVHPIGFAKKVIEITNQELKLPSWGWMLPINLDDNDIASIDELNKFIADFRIVLKKAVT